jgi:predicted CopG family antitoxin
MSTIAIDPDVKESLKELKITENESYNSIIKRLVVEVKEKKEYKPMFPKEENTGRRESHIKDFDAWLDRKLIEDKEILDALGRK